MQVNLYYKCSFCGAVCNLKYQMGFSKKHPIRYKCSCGITIRGEFRETKDTREFIFENAQKTDDEHIDYVVYSSGDLLTLPQYKYDPKGEPLGITSFILTTMSMDLNYEEFRNEFSRLITYRDSRRPVVMAINEYYRCGNHELLKSTIKKYFDPEYRIFPLSNKADILRAVTMINQFQFLGDGSKEITFKTKDLFGDTVKQHPSEASEYFKFLNSLGRMTEWKRKIVLISDQFYEKIDLMIPAVGIDYYEADKKEILSGQRAITTTSFEEIKQLYVDLYELICSLLILVIGFDNIILNGDYNKVSAVPGLNVKTLEDVSNMRNKGNILKLINADQPFGKMVCTCLNADVRNSIGHFSYDADDVSDNGQMIRFYNREKMTDYTELSLGQICYDIWKMYNCLGLFNELIHNVELQILSETEGIVPSFINNESVYNRIMGKKASRRRAYGKKIYPNEPCPCNSGKKYKKCCGSKRPK